jgi:hypothetical protein
MMTFMVMARVTSSAWQRGVMYALAVSSALFVVWANLQSGLVWYLSILIPSITIGVSMVYEHWFVASIKEERRVRSAYQTALNAYQTAMTNPTQHPDYIPYLRQGVFEMLLTEQSGAGATARKQWLAGLSVPERAYVADAEIALNDWHIDAIAPSITPTPAETIITQSADTLVIEAQHVPSNGNGHRGKLQTHNGA